MRQFVLVGVLMMLWSAPGCGGSGSDGEDGVTQEDASQDVISPEDGISVPDGRDVDMVEPGEVETDTGPVGPSAIALRLETRFGTTQEWKGVTTVSPSGFVHTETDTGTACEKLAESRYIDELTEVVETYDPFSWDADYTGSNDGSCPSTTLLMVLHIESIGDGRSHTIRWCEDQAEEIAGAPELLNKMNKLKADAKTNGTCDVLQFLLGRPTPTATLGYDDGLANVLVLAKYRSPDFCLVLYSQYSPDVYQTTQVMGVDEAYIEELLGLYLPITEHAEFFDQLIEFCPNAAPVLMEASLASDLAPPIASFVVASLDSGSRIWMGTQGVAAIQPAGPEGEPIVINVNGMEFHPLSGMDGSPTLELGPWNFEWLESTAFEVQNIGPPPEAE